MKIDTLLHCFKSGQFKLKTISRLVLSKNQKDGEPPPRPQVLTCISHTDYNSKKKTRSQCSIDSLARASCTKTPGRVACLHTNLLAAEQKLRSSARSPSLPPVYLQCTTDWHPLYMCTEAIPFPPPTLPGASAIPPPFKFTGLSSFILLIPHISNFHTVHNIASWTTSLTHRRQI